MIERRCCPDVVLWQLARSRESGRNVIRVRRPGVVRLVTAVARRGQRSVVVVHMARRTRNGDVCACQRKRRRVVVERRRGP